MTAWTWIDGRVLPAGEARVSASDRGLLLGEGIYETCAVIAGQPFALRRHLDRLRHSAEILGLPMPWAAADLRAACMETIEVAVAAGVGQPASEASHLVNGGDRHRLRITVTGGKGPLGPHLASEDQVPTLLVHVGPWTPWAPTATAVTVPWPVNERSASVGAKCTSRVDLGLALREARRQGADEAMLVNSAGHLCEGAGSNVFLDVDGILQTPSLATGCLAGVTRALVCELVPVVERIDLTVADLLAAPEVFLTSSTRGVHPLGSLDQHRYGPVPGPLTAGAMEALRTLQASSMDP